ncbi:MAG: DUF928 domain-containing protein [Spirulinaceae cyanobacterium]
MKFLTPYLSAPSITWLLLVGAMGYAAPATAASLSPAIEQDLPSPAQIDSGAPRSSHWNFVPAPDEGAPRQSQGGASRGSLNFVPASGAGAPRQSQGGASRGNFNFVPASGAGAPRQSQGGASRGEWSFIPPAGSGQPSQSRGGASRGDWNFIPAPESDAPQHSRGGASRDEWNFTPAPEDGAPRQSRGGASRNDWPQQLLTLTPEAGYGQTTASHPQFLFYLPESNAQSGVFRLKDEAGTVVYEQTLTDAHQAGIVAIQLPEHLPALEVEQYYQWYVVLQFDAELQPASPFVEAWVKRVEPTPEMHQAQADGQTLAYAELMAKSGIWYDTVATLNQLRATEPSSAELANHWQELLTSVGLESVVTVPAVLD